MANKRPEKSLQLETDLEVEEEESGPQASAPVLDQIAGGLSRVAEGATIQDLRALILKLMPTRTEDARIFVQRLERLKYAAESAYLTAQENLARLSS